MHLLDSDQAKDRLVWTGEPRAFAARKISSDARRLERTMDHLDALEAQSIYIFREAFARLRKLCLLYTSDAADE